MWLRDVADGHLLDDGSDTTGGDGPHPSVRVPSAGGHVYRGPHTSVHVGQLCWGSCLQAT